MIQIKRIYDSASPQDGRRILVDRLWPRGIKKDKAAISEWLKDIAPSNELRKWFSHDPAKWAEFKKKYQKELKNKSVILKRIREDALRETVTLLYAAKNGEFNNAAVLKDLLETDR
jgi:uncharacterized protein YeaO (DUF488 family)